MSENYLNNSIKAIEKIVNNDYTITFENREYYFKNMYSEDPQDDIEHTMECQYLREDSFGVPGSGFLSCSCEDMSLCKYAGSEFKHWDKNDLNPSEIGCRKTFNNQDILGE